MEQQTNIPWIEKYRPTHFDDIVLDPINRVFFQKMIDKNCFPNLLFNGPPGSGKTSTIINLINEYQRRYNVQNHLINKGNIIHLNAYDERGIDIVRNQLLHFVSTKNLFDNGLKFVILDEVDYMTKTAQQALKYLLLQSCSQNVRFCLICNYISKIDESLQNEFICIRFNQLPVRDIHHFIRNMCEKENVQITDDMISKIIGAYQSDIRSMINFIQSNHRDLQISNIIPQELWKTLDKSESSEIFVKQVEEISEQYRIHKRQLLNHYCDYVIRNVNSRITRDFLNGVEQIVHNSEGIPVEVLVTYFAKIVVGNEAQN